MPIAILVVIVIAVFGVAVAIMVGVSATSAPSGLKLAPRPLRLFAMLSMLINLVP